MRDEDIDFSDIPKVTATDVARAVTRVSGKVALSGKPPAKRR